MSISVPIKALYEAVGFVITCETVTGEIYRGLLIEAEDSMSCHLKNVTVTNRQGTMSKSEDVYIRGSKITFFILPDMLMNSPMFNNQPHSGTARRVMSAIVGAQAAREGYGNNPQHERGGHGSGSRGRGGRGRGSRGRGGRERATWQGWTHRPGVHGRGGTSSM